MNTLQHLTVTFALAAQLALLCCFPGVLGEGESVPALVSAQGSPHGEGVRQKRAPGWGKRSGDLDAFDSEASDELLDSDDSDAEKRAPGWGKRDFDMDKRAPGWGKRAPGWGKRAPGWGKRAPGWGKRAPGWGKRAPGWGKRAPGWGKRSFSMAEPEDKRAPGWGKRAPGWGKRAPGWGKRSLGEDNSVCQVLKEELDFFMGKAVEVSTAQPPQSPFPSPLLFPSLPSLPPTAHTSVVLLSSLVSLNR